MKSIARLFTILAFAGFSSTSLAQYRDVKLPEKPKASRFSDLNRRDTGFWVSADVEGGASTMVNRTNMQFAGLAVSGGYRFSEYIRVGVGFGGRYYVHNADYRKSHSDFGMPIFVNARGNFMSAYDRQNVPFWSVNLGGIVNDGVYFSPTVGYSFGGTRNTFQIGVTYNLIEFKNYMDKSKTYSYMGLKLGYEF